MHYEVHEHMPDGKVFIKKLPFYSEYMLGEIRLYIMPGFVMRNVVLVEKSEDNTELWFDWK